MPVHQLMTGTVNDFYRMEMLKKYYTLDANLVEQLIKDFHDRQITEQLSKKEGSVNLREVLAEKKQNVKQVALTVSSESGQRDIYLSFDIDKPEQWCAAVYNGDNNGYTASFIYPTQPTNKQFQKNQGKQLLRNLDTNDTYQKIIDFIVDESNGIHESRLVMLQQLVNNNANLDLDANALVLDKAMMRYEQLTKATSLPSSSKDSVSGNPIKKMMLDQWKKFQKDCEQYKINIIVEYGHQADEAFDEMLAIVEYNFLAAKRYITLISELSSGISNQWAKDNPNVANSIAVAMNDLSSIYLDENLFNEYQPLVTSMVNDIKAIQEKDNLFSTTKRQQDSTITLRKKALNAMPEFAKGFVVSGVVAGATLGVIALLHLAIAGTGPLAFVAGGVLATAFIVSSVVEGISAGVALVSAIGFLAVFVAFCEHALKIHRLKKVMDTANSDILKNKLSVTVGTIQEKNNSQPDEIKCSQNVSPFLFFANTLSRPGTTEGYGDEEMKTNVV